jgi:phosphate/sulfate permease
MAIITQFQVSTWQGILAIILTVILVPLVSLVVRFFFELLMVPFAISKNLAKIKKELFGCCECEGCCGEEEVEGFDVEDLIAVAEPVVVTPVKKAPVKKTPVKKPVAKKPAPKKTVSKK